MSISLAQAFERIAPEIGAAVDDLLAYADEDHFTGFDNGQGNWPGGSVWTVEGKFLYAVVRHLRPTRVLEIGTAYGCSATHILQALHVNEHGTLTSLDIQSSAGAGIPDELRDQHVFVAADALVWLGKNRKKFDLVFEDGLHTREFTEAAIRAAWDTHPAVLLSHDVMHFSDYGRFVRESWDAAFGEDGYQKVLIDPSDCGLAWKVRE